jgi:hypothetical protein
MRRLVVIVVALLVSTCGGSSPSSPSLNLSGNWSGTIVDSLAGTGVLHMTVAQSGSSLTGTAASVYPTGQGGGSFAGTLNGTNITGTTTPSVPTLCPSNFTAVVNSAGTQLSGTLAAFNCTVPETATLNLTKQ